MNSQGSAVIVFLSLITIGVLAALCYPQYFSERTYQANAKAIFKGNNKKTIGGQISVRGQKKPIVGEVIDSVTPSYDEASKVAPYNSSNRRPDCLNWYKVKKGDTQWSVAVRYSKNVDKKDWLKSMRWVSRKGVGDTSMSIGESVCIEWGLVI